MTVRGVSTGVYGLYGYTPKISPSRLYGVKMTSKRLLNMSINFYTSLKILYKSLVTPLMTAGRLRQRQKLQTPPAAAGRRDTLPRMAPGDQKLLTAVSRSRQLRVVVLVLVIYATADEADAYNLCFTDFFCFSPFSVRHKNTRQPFSGTAERIFMKLTKR